ncbi:MAG: FAD-binding oxidoreductase [Bacteroidetes bacterium]|nr:FAD-binding oxidoreductase [Bacteroidota bacterium]
MAQQVDTLIIGQGICGTFLSFHLERAGVPHLVIDELRPYSASRIAAGLINPVTGRRLVTTWMIDELLASALESYGQLAAMLGDSYLSETSITDFFPTAQMRLAFLDRLAQNGSYLNLPADETRWNACFRYEMGFGTIRPCYLVDMQGLLAAARKRMLEQGFLLEQRFEKEQLQIGTDQVRYGDLTARRVIFCDGIESFTSPWFPRLPFAPNKGEVLIVDIPGLKGCTTTESPVFKKGISLAPWRDGLYWAGSSYEWSFNTEAPTKMFREKTELLLKNWVKLPFTIVDHLASVRPATIERRPFVGFHPLYRPVGILNGMGTKGCSLAPYFARQLAAHITTGSPIRPDADVQRFIKLLSR